MKNTKTGTKEWADKNINIINGCSNDCIYCYAKAMAIRHKRKTPETWCIEELKQNSLSRNFRKTDKKIMFPSSHDIGEEFVDEALIMLKKLLKVGNEVLIVSKPSPKVIRELCSQLEDYKALIEFRFTIGSADNETLKLWEPGAPTFEERLEALKHAHYNGFTTSVSCEPMLDENIVDVVSAVDPYVENTIWIGKMNRIKQHIGHSKIYDDVLYSAMEHLIEFQQSDENMNALVNELSVNSKIRLKDSLHKYIS